MAVDSVLDEDEVIEAQWCERQALRLDRWCSFMLTSTGKFCDTLVTLEALKPSEEKILCSAHVNLPMRKFYLNWLCCLILMIPLFLSTPLYLLNFLLNSEVHVKNCENSMWNVKIHKFNKPSKEMWEFWGEVSLEPCHWCLERMLNVVHWLNCCSFTTGTGVQ